MLVNTIHTLTLKCVLSTQVHTEYKIAYKAP